jgi:hypothetical protein
MPRNCALLILHWYLQLIIQVEDEGVSVAQKLILFQASPLSSGETPNARAVLELHKADCWSLAVTLLMEILSCPAIFFCVKNHFHFN